MPTKPSPEALAASFSTIHRVRQQFVEDSFEAALNPRRPRKRPAEVTDHRGGRTAADRFGLRRAAARPRALDRGSVGGSAGGVGIVVRASRETIG